jgi:8-oxo-dGTP pyrophosphatase MutT (NUDIX family)
MESGCLIGTGALIFCKSTKRYLFLLRNGDRHDGSWGLVGGKVEAGETVVEGLTREIAEELGGKIIDATLIPIEKFTSDSKNFEYHTYQITVDEEFVPVLNKEHRGYCWVQLEDHPKPLHPGVWRTFKFSSVIDKIKTLETVV